MILTGTDGYSRGTTVSAGRLIATNSSAMPANTSLTMGRGRDTSSSIRILRMSGDYACRGRQLGRCDRRVDSSFQPHVRGVQCRVRRGVSCNIQRYERDNCRAVAHKPGFCRPGILAPGAVDISVSRSVARPSTVHVFNSASDSLVSDDSDQHHKKNVVLLALDTVLAQYGQ